jgi:hypothetical protein
MTPIPFTITLTLGQQHLHDVVGQFYPSVLHALPTNKVVGKAC